MSRPRAHVRPHVFGPIRPGLLPETTWNFDPHVWDAVSLRQQIAAKKRPHRVPCDLLNGRSWPIRDQRSTPMCTAFAANACLELLHAERTADIPYYSSSFLYYYMVQSAQAAQAAGQPVFDGETLGFTRFQDAQAVLADKGVCDATDWPDDESGAPSKQALAKAVARQTTNISVLSFPPGSHRPANLSDRIYQELTEGRPVGVGMPTYMRPEDMPQNNWTRAFVDGLVAMPDHRDIVDKESGHAVCIFGWMPARPQDSIDHGGYFLFRNSFGLRFAAAPVTLLPAGYGLLPADLVDEASWGVLLMRRNG